MARIQVPEGDGPERQRVWSLRPEAGGALRALTAAVYEHGILEAREAELMRYRIALVNGCER